MAVATTWRLDPPARCTRRFKTDIEVEVHLVIREVREGKESWSVKGVPLTKKGNPNGNVDYRYITDDAMDELRNRVLGDG